MKSIPILMAIVGGVIYHLSSKSFPKALNPLVGIIFAYVSAIVVCLGALFFTSKVSWSSSFKEINLAVVGIGLGAAIVEIGFVMAYRAGWQLGMTSFLVNVSVTITLLVIAYFVVRERISPSSLLGFVLCLAGLFLITRGSN